MRTSEVLHTAADLIERQGWTTGTSGWPGYGTGSALCLEGGIIAALGMTFRDIRERGIRQALWDCPAYQAVEGYTNTPRAGDSGTDGRLWRFNDKIGRTASEVIEVLRAAAAIEAAREDAAAADMLALMSAPVTDAQVLAEMGGTA